MKKELILQVNIPLCVRRCAHCAQPFGKYSPGLASAYVEALLKEIEAVAPDMSDYAVTAVSLEGGSPALLAPADLQAVLRALRRGFDLAPDVQISLQTMPGDYSRALMEKMRDNGVNFWIVGLATADLREHELLRRPYRFDALTMVDAAVRAFNPRDLSFELLYGIPGQTPKSWTHTLDAALAYAPEHLTLLPLDLSVGSALRAQCEAGLLTPPEPEAVRAMRDRADERLTRLGYRACSQIDYCLPGREYRFRAAQLRGAEQLGLGYRAVTVMDGFQYINGHSLEEYLAHSDDYQTLAANVVPLEGNPRYGSTRIDNVSCIE